MWTESVPVRFTIIPRNTTSFSALSVNCLHMSITKADLPKVTFTDLILVIICAGRVSYCLLKQYQFTGMSANARYLLDMS